MVSERMIRAADYCAPDERPVTSASRLARAVLDALAETASVSVTMEAVPGASSSFYNVLFSELAAALGPAVVKRRVNVVGLGKTQAQIANRSRMAVLGS
jgi:hypothetical protein